MNELIKKLANESGYYLYDLTETHGIKTVETDSKDEWITLEKFAELIVAECIKLNGKELAMPGHSRMVDVYCEHFGIEL
jgi:hypothetical protein